MHEAVDRRAQKRHSLVDASIGSERMVRLIHIESARGEGRLGNRGWIAPKTDETASEQVGIKRATIPGRVKGMDASLHEDIDFTGNFGQTAPYNKPAACRWPQELEQFTI